MSDFPKKGTGHGSKFSRKQEEALGALLTAPTLIEAARIVGISSSTLARWKEEPEFKKRYRQVRSSSLESTTARLRGFCVLAAETLAEVASDRKASSSARVAAAGKILDLSFRAEEIENLSQRLDELETQSMARDSK